MLHLSILGTVNLSSRTDVQTDVQNVPVDTDSVIHKLLVLLKFSWNVVHLEGIELLLSRTILNTK